MPIYEFVCRKCKDSFRESASIKKKKAGKIACPECKSKDLQPKRATGGNNCKYIHGHRCPQCGMECGREFVRSVYSTDGMQRCTGFKENNIYEISDELP